MAVSDASSSTFATRELRSCSARRLNFWAASFELAAVRRHPQSRSSHTTKRTGRSSGWKTLSFLPECPTPQPGKERRADLPMKGKFISSAATSPSGSFPANDLWVCAGILKLAAGGLGRGTRPG